MLDRDFKGIWIPADVWLDTRLNAAEKILLCEIDSLSTTEHGCFASNKYLADFCQLSETKVSTAISKLISLGYVTLEEFNGRSRVLKTAFQILKGSLSNSERQTFKNCKADFQNLKDINNSTNKLVEKNSIVPPISPTGEKRFKPPSVDEVKAYCLERGNSVDANNFVDFYSSKGWMVGRNKMKDWRAAVRTWERGNRKAQKSFTEMLSDDF